MPVCVTYMAGQQIRANGRVKKDAPQNLGLGPHVSIQEEDTPGGGPLGGGRPLRSAEPGWAPVLVQLGQRFDLMLQKAVPTCFHTYLGGNRPVWAIKGAFLPPLSFINSLSTTHSHISISTPHTGEGMQWDSTLVPLLGLGQGVCGHVWSIAGLVAMLLSCTSLGMNHLSKYLSLSSGNVLGQLFACCYSLAGSSSILVADALAGAPDKDE